MGIAIMHRRVMAIGGLPEYTYTGAHQLIDDGGGNWRIKFLSSGTLIPKKKLTIDVFCVGGGGSGGNNGGVAGIYQGAGGGGGGYTQTVHAVTIASNEAISVTVGAGGAQNTATGEGNGNDGGTSQIMRQTNSEVLATASGGKAGIGPTGSGGSRGGAGGSGGGAGSGSGGSDGGDGHKTMDSTGSGWGIVDGGVGQGTTTREFGEGTGALYSGGGGGGMNNFTSDTQANHKPNGGAGGGGNGCQAQSWTTDEDGNVSVSNKAPTAGTANTGGDGGGGGQNNYRISPAYRGQGAAGGSGIIIIRNAR